MEGLKFIGRSTIEVKHEDGRIDVYKHHNMVVDSGFEFIMSRIMNNTVTAPMQYLAIGTGTGASGPSMTALTSEKYRKQGQWTHTTGTKKFKITAAWAKGAVIGNISEVGVFNASSGGTMLDRVLYTVPVVGSSEVAITVSIEFEVL